MENRNIALIGSGYWGQNLLRVFKELGVLKTICDVNENILKIAESQGFKTAKDYKEVLNDKDIEGVGIATPAATHFKIVKDCLLAGKHVFVEKPLALNAGDGEELVKIAKQKNLILLVGHLLLYHPAILKIKELIDEGFFGDVKYICSNRLNFGKLRREENVLWSFAPHDLSVILLFFGRMPKRARSVSKTYLFENVPDITLSFLEFEENKGAHIFVSWLNPHKEQLISIVGEKGMASFDGVKNQLTVYNHKIEDNLTIKKSEAREIELEAKEPLMEEIKDFVDCIREKRLPKADPESALNVLRVLEMCQKSINNNGDFVERI